MNDNWADNTRPVFITLGATNHTNKGREKDDYYATDPIAIDVLLNDGRAKLAHKVWECACGEGHLAKRLEEKGYKVYASDLIDRGYGRGGCDFLSINKENVWDGTILTNPPYKYAQQFIEQALRLVTPGNRIYMFLKLQFLEGKARKKLFDKKELKTLYVSSGRILCAKNADFEGMKAGGGSAVAFGWFCWQKGYCGDPVIKWVN